MVNFYIPKFGYSQPLKFVEKSLRLNWWWQHLKETVHSKEKEHEVVTAKTAVKTCIIGSSSGHYNYFFVGLKSWCFPRSWQLPLIRHPANTCHKKLSTKISVMPRFKPKAAVLEGRTLPLCCYNFFHYPIYIYIHGEVLASKTCRGALLRRIVSL